MTFSEYVKVHTTTYGLDLTDTQIDQLQRFYEQVVTTNEHMNLTGITEPEEFALKHVVDSLSCYDPKYFTKGATVIDLGTGAGFPGVPLGIYDPSLQITLFDSLQKRLRFLDGVIEDLGLQGCSTLHGRAEDLAHQEHRESFDLLTSRAVARLSILLEWGLPYVKVGGYMVALKGSIVQEELEESKCALSILGGEIVEVKEVTLPTLDDKRAIVYIKKVKPTPKKYPRKPKEIKTKPL